MHTASSGLKPSHYGVEMFNNPCEKLRLENVLDGLIVERDAFPSPRPS
jgi:hypothetical protein